MATAAEVQAFLDQFRLCVGFGAKVQFRPTPKNIDGLATLNMTEAQAIDQACHLAIEDYCGGPEPDRDEDNREVWIFGYMESGTEVYIKLRLDPNKPFSRPVIRSFHPAEHPLCYPLRRKAVDDE
jgi:hypothetical protein